MKPFLHAGLWILSLMMFTTISSLTKAPAFIASFARRPYSVPFRYTHTVYHTTSHGVTKHITRSKVAHAILLLDFGSLSTLSATRGS